jgi:peroxiredoxin Q/BCP
MKTKIGDRFPEFNLTGSDGKKFESSRIIGHKAVVIYFYPKDETAGCTAQACAFRDSYQDFKDAGAEVIGISSDSAEAHNGFAQNHQLPFILLSDINGEFRKQIGVPGSMLGLLPGRVTYVLDKKGIVRYIFNSQLNINKHIKESLSVLKEISNEE